MNLTMNLTADARADFATIARWIQPSAKVLDLGCGDGSLLRYLKETRGARGSDVRCRARDRIDI